MIFDVLVAIKDAEIIVHKQLESHAIDINIKSNANDSMVQGAYEIDGYENEFKQVIINLLNNAREAILMYQKDHEIKGKITILVQRIQRKIIIQIQDNGGGIDEAVLMHIFDPYVSTKHEQQGTGIGLYLAQLIIERNMLGSIYAANSEDGAVFTITLPAANG